MKNLLSQVLENIRLGNREEAQKLFNEYVTDKSSFIISELYGDSDFEAEIEKYVMNTERYYHEARELMASGADYSEWEDFVKKVAMENDIMPEGEDDVHDAAQGLMRDREMLGESQRNMSDVDFLYHRIMKIPTYYDDMVTVDVDGHDSDWKPFILNVADDSGISVDDETIEKLTQKLKAYVAMDDSNKKRPRWVNESDYKKDRNFVAKHMNKVNRSAKHRDKKNDYRRNPKHKKKITDE